MKSSQRASYRWPYKSWHGLTAAIQSKRDCRIPARDPTDIAQGVILPWSGISEWVVGSDPAIGKNNQISGTQGPTPAMNTH